MSYRVLLINASVSFVWVCVLRGFRANVSSLPTKCEQVGRNEAEKGLCCLSLSARRYSHRLSISPSTSPLDWSFPSLHDASLFWPVFTSLSMLHQSAEHLAIQSDGLSLRSMAHSHFHSPNAHKQLGIFLTFFPHQVMVAGHYNNLFLWEYLCAVPSSYNPTVVNHRSAAKRDRLVADFLYRNHPRKLICKRKWV